MALKHEAWPQSWSHMEPVAVLADAPPSSLSGALPFLRLFAAYATNISFRKSNSFCRPSTLNQIIQKAEDPWGTAFVSIDGNKARPLYAHLQQLYKNRTSALRLDLQFRDKPIVTYLGAVLRFKPHANIIDSRFLKISLIDLHELSHRNNFLARVFLIKYANIQF